MNDLVSIVIPSYKSASTIAETLESCFAQTYTPLEIIVVDDGSNDETVAIVKSYGTKVLLIEQVNQGPAIARNTGIMAAKGEYIQFCDSDDLLQPDKIAKSMRLLQSRPDAALVYCKMQPITQQGQILSELPTAPPDDYFGTERLFCKLLKANGSAIQTSTILARKSALVAVGAYRADPNHRCAEDWDLLLRLAQDYPFLGIDEALVYYRHRLGALTTQAILMAEGRLQTIRYARHYPARQACFSDEQYNQLEAGRYHLLAITYWEAEEKKKAQQAFLHAAKLYPQGAVLRYLYAFLCLFLPVTISKVINRHLKRRS